MLIPLIPIITCLISLIASLTLAETAVAEPLDFAAFRVKHGDFLRLISAEGRDIELRYLFEPDRDFEDGAADVSVQELYLSAELPLPVTDELFLRLAPLYSLRSFDLDSATLLDAPLYTEYGHKIQFGFGAGYFLTDKLMITALLQPSIISDLQDNLSSDDLKYFGHAVLAYEFFDDAQFLLGILSNEHFDSVHVYPIIGIRARSGPWYLKLTPPIEAAIRFRTDRGLEIYTGFWLSGDEYHAQLNKNLGDYNIQIQDRRLGAGATYWIDNHWNVFAECGANLNSTFDFEFEGQDIPNAETDTGFYTRLGFAYAL